MSDRDDIKQELESHIADGADELIATGVSPEDAYAQARARFGNVQKYERETLSVMRRRSLMHPTFVASVAMAVAIVLSLGYWLKQYPLNGVLAQPILLSLLYVGIFSVVIIVIKLLSEYWGLRSLSALWSAILFGLMVCISITIMHDIDKVLVPFHAIVLASIIVVGLMRFWSRLPVFFKKVCIYGFALVTTWSALHGKELFRFIQPDACLYLTRDTTPLVGELAHCQQLAFFHPLLWPVYFVIIVGVIGGAYFLSRYWRNQGSALGRKLFVSAAFAVLPLLSLSFPDINNYGAVDIISWKPEIYLVYQEILGRQPEQKDIEFYTYTRAYRTMSRVKDVLYASYERTLVIDNLHRAIIGRPASSVEIEYFVQGRQSVEEIRHELEQQVPGYR
ncbi:MAG: permease prefix domain 1-containing protein [Patescibacteria group bacterium]